MSFGDFMGGVGKVSDALGQGLFPADPNDQGMVDPSVAAAARNRGLINLGLGIMRAPYSMNGTASGLLDAYNGSTNDYDKAMDSAFKHTLLKRAADSQQQDEENKHTMADLALRHAQQSERTDAAVTAQKVLRGLSNAKDQNAYWQLASADPEVKSALGTLGIQGPDLSQQAATPPPMLADPNQAPAPSPFQDFASKLQSAVAINGAPAAPVKVGKDETIIQADPNDPTKYTTLYKGEGNTDVKWEDTGTQLVPRLANGQPAPGVAPIAKSKLETPGGFDDKGKALLASLSLAGVSLSGRSKEQQAAAVSGLIEKYPLLTTDEIAAKVKTGQITIAGDKASAVNLEKIATATHAYSANLEKNLGNLESVINAADKTGVPRFNKAVIDFKSNFAGDKDTSQIVLYLQDVESEFAKLKSGSLGNVAPSDAAMAEAKTAILQAYSKGGFAGMKKAILTTAANKKSSYDAELAALRGGPPVAAAPAADSAGWGIKRVDQ